MALAVNINELINGKVIEWELCTYFLTTLPINHEFMVGAGVKEVSDQDGDQVDDQVSDQVSAKSDQDGAKSDHDDDKSVHDDVKSVHDDVNSVRSTLTILAYCEEARSRKEILNKLDLSNHFYNYQRYLEPLITKGLLIMTSPDKHRSSIQKYITTQKGKELIKNAIK